MKKILLFLVLFFSLYISARAATLVEVFTQALCSDPIYQQAVFQRLSDKQGVPISLASVLPSLGAVLNPTITKTNVSGVTNFIGDNTQRGYTFNVTLTQTVFNFAQFANVERNFSITKQADATLNAATQDLMLRVARAYFTILQDEDNLAYLDASRKAFAEQLDQVTQQYNVGLKTITDVYTARASYDASVAQYIGAETKLFNDRENLRVITGVYYTNLAKLSKNFPLISPKPADPDEWVCIAQRQNWAIRAAQYAADAARINIKQQFAGHLPNLQAQGIYNITYSRTIADQPDTVAIPVSGANHSTAYGGGLILNIPIVQGGLVVANTCKAQFDYQVSYQKLEQTIRNTINTTRQSYLGILSGISQIHADEQTIKSSISSLEGMRAGYQVGTQTLFDVLNQQQKLVLTLQTYAADRYTYVNNLLALKSAAGILSCQDLVAVSSWLTYDPEETAAGCPLYQWLPPCLRTCSHHKRGSTPIPSLNLKPSSLPLPANTLPPNTPRPERYMTNDIKTP